MTEKLPQHETSRPLTEIIRNYREGVSRFVDPKKALAALSILLLIESGCDRQPHTPLETTIQYDGRQEIARANQDEGKVSKSETQITTQSNDSELIAGARAEIAAQLENNVKEAEVEKICAEVLPEGAKIVAINILSDKKIICALTERDVESAAHEEGIDFQAVLMKDEAGNLKYITHFGADTSDAAAYELRTNPEVRQTGLNKEELNWMLVTYSSEGLITAK